MASTSEKTFGQRLTRAVALYDRVKGEVGYAPEENPLITTAALGAFVATLKAANQEVGDLAQPYNQAQDDRVVLYHGLEGLKKRVAMARDVIGGYQNGKKLAAYDTLTTIAQQMRGYRKPAKDLLPDGAATDAQEAAAGLSVAQMSFGSLLQKGREALGTLKGMGGQYKTSNALVTVAGLEAFLTQLETQDTTVNDTLLPLRKATKARHTLYEGDEGLQARLAAAKSYVAGNHTKTSPLYKDVLKIKY